MPAAKNIMRYSIMQPDRLKMFDTADKVMYGCDQEWYPTPWQRMSGCGPSVASNVLLYLQRAGRIRFPIEVHDKTDFITLMEHVWKYVTPTSQGLYLLSHFCQGMTAIFESIQSAIQCETLDIPWKGKSRPDFSTVMDFIRTGISQDAPIAFLNLSNGSLKNLDGWHWVTVIALDHDEKNETTYLDLFDNGKSVRINLTEWYTTTVLGGGFIRFV